ncbi:YifB family Mg chelatase-like AAA ATPase [Salinimonas sediminis]|uniref:ATP-dependent protease n=1 Tax=Salinimonas sediminis TaxID=2303538 RepID=A0A346NHE2_9ALTE|nr:YifB family Mg chelatase-like AAA ATPase [Salinimonas sediminis]AXR04949.1 ATP-dependent protease [Salinimonas sediminis]
MGYAVVSTRAGEGVNAPQVQVEVHLANGLPAFHLVGMAETCVKEARDRVRSALINSGFEFPAKRITVNLAPATIPKQGGRYDLPIAIGILIACKILPEQQLANTELIGELGLNGTLKAVRGIVPALLAARAANSRVFYPAPNQSEAELIDTLKGFGAPDLLSVYNHFAGILALKAPSATASAGLFAPGPAPRWDDIIGQSQAKRTLLLAAAAGHNLLFVGPPGTGKSLLANRLLHLLPPLSVDEALEVAAIHSVKGEPLGLTHLFKRPFRAPHHTCSAVALTGGGSQPLPGEISLAHHGVLFLDELPEFGRRALDVLREPLETGDICISRAHSQATYPARFQLIAAMNPSPTGDLHDNRSSADQTLRYINRLSGPFLDRIDIQVEVPRLPSYVLTPPESTGPDSAIEASRLVTLARKAQMARQQKLNSQLHPDELAGVCQLSAADMTFLQQACHTLKLSMRVFHRVLKVARTIADIDNSAVVTRQHLAEALGYRALDKIITQLSSS